MSKDINKDQIIGIAIAVVGALAAFVSGRTFTFREKIAENERLKNMPDSYWEAEKAKAESAAKQHELDIAMKERLALDERERKAKEAAAKLEFEKTAPPEYWAAMAKKIEAEERGKTERENAQLQAEAIKKAAEEVRRAAIGY